MAFAAFTVVHTFERVPWRHALIACVPVKPGGITAESISAKLNHKTKPMVQFFVNEAYKQETQNQGEWTFFNVVTGRPQAMQCYTHENADKNDCYYEVDEAGCKHACHGHCVWVDEVCDPPTDWENDEQRDAGFHELPCGQAEWAVLDETVIAFAVEAFAPGCHTVGHSFSWEKAERDSRSAAQQNAQQKFIVGANVGTFGFATISQSAMIAVALGVVVGAMGMRVVGLRVVHARSSSSDEVTLLETQ